MTDAASGSPQEQRHLEGLLGFATEYCSASLDRDRSPFSMRKFVRRLSVVADSSIDSLDRDRIVCGAGCCHCCVQLVAATVPEVLSVAAYVRESYSAEQLAGLKDRLKQYREVSLATPDLHKASVLRVVCPLLRDNLCSVFPARPLICRGFNSTDVSACVRLRENPGKKVTVMRNQSQMAITLALQEGMRQVLVEKSLSPWNVDLSLALGIALDQPDADERYLAGEPLFESARIWPEWSGWPEDGA